MSYINNIKVGYCNQCGTYNSVNIRCNCANKKLDYGFYSDTSSTVNLDEPELTYEEVRTEAFETTGQYLSDKELDTLLNKKVNDAGEATSVAIEATLQQRGDRYGKFSKHSKISQDLQTILFSAKSKDNMPEYINEALILICHKLARVVNGDHMYDDNFRDIAGYSQLVVDILNGKDI